jgi:hypothetical protein
MRTKIGYLNQELFWETILQTVVEKHFSHLELPGGIFVKLVVDVRRVEIVK